MLNDIMNFLKDGSLSFGKKSLVVIFVFIIALGLNYYFGFSFNYRVNQHLSQIEKIAQIRQTYTISESLEKELENLEYKIINKNRLFKSLFQDFIIQAGDEFIYDTLFYGDTIKIIQRIDSTQRYLDDDIFTYQEYSWIKHLLTSSYGFILVLILLIFIPFFNIKQFWITLLGSIIFIILNLVVIWLNYQLFSLIPVFQKVWINYLLNFLLHTSIIILVFYLTFSKRKQK